MAIRSCSRELHPTLPTDREGSIFQRIFSGPAGIDPYASAVSDVYQDLFREGSYTGKGIYDVDVFETALDGKVTENTLLSHDLFEGFSRGRRWRRTLSYSTSIHRTMKWRHRGNIAGRVAIGSSCRGYSEGRMPKDKARNIHIPAISRWKMLDNLR